MLHFDSEVYPSREEFMRLCAENLSKSDLNALMRMDDQVGPDDPDDPVGRASRGGGLKKWFDWNLSLSAELAILRAQELGLDAGQNQGIEKIPGTEEIAREAFNQESPLIAEDALDRARWAVLEELEVGHYFDLRKLSVYGFKISILERKSQFDMDKGLDNFNRIYSTVTDAKIGEQPE